MTVCVRPEDVLVEDGGGGRVLNQMEARVAELEFVGNFFRARLAPDCLEGMILAADLPTPLVRGRHVDRGQSLSIALPCQRPRVYPAVS